MPVHTTGRDDHRIGQRGLADQVDDRDVFRLHVLQDVKSEGDAVGRRILLHGFLGKRLGLGFATG